MISSPMLDVIISMIFIYFLFSTLTSSIEELWASYYKNRGEMLKKAIQKVLNDPLNKHFGDLIYMHPAIDILGEANKRKPAYIEGRNFATTLIELISSEAHQVNYMQDEETGKMTFEIEQSGKSLIERFKAGVDKLRYSDLTVLLYTFLQNYEKKIDSDVKFTQEMDEKLISNIETWYNNYMDRVTGWYKKDVKKSIFLKSIIVALIFNVNFFIILKTVYTNTSLKGAAIGSASVLTKDSVKNLPPDSVKNELNKLYEIGLPVGWDMSGLKDTTSSLSLNFIPTIHHQIRNSGGYTYSIIGWLISAVIISFGAPFWFDVLKKLVNVRNGGLKP
ncbi:hypothetical protein [Emticicia sp. BO119]|uniref:hypothetical protein n=1 Tax=Emticicia sp. BO119 TaxID=2757768 RepID=UPI0015F05268|nr:hypothetical protein [Emticicia sp. BO119]MBA4853255.1 hypothetical protein [Emticicia sp. BO119]